MPLTKYRRQPGGNWYLRGTVAGHSVHESTRTSVARQAEAIRVRREAQLLERHSYGRAATLTFAEAALAYMDAGGEARFLGRILEHFGPDTRVVDIDNPAVNDAAKALYPNAAASTINRQLIVPISAVITMAAEDHGLPLKRIKRRSGDRARTRWLTPEEAERLIVQVKARCPHLLPAIGLMLGGGARPGEALAVEVGTFYPATAQAWIPDTKNGHPRMIALPRRALDLVTAHELPEAGAICRTPKGKPYVQRENGGGQISAAFAGAAEAAKLDPREVTPHVLRHTWATWFDAVTGDFGRLLELGGWRKADMAMRYRKIAPADLPARLEVNGWDFTAIGAAAVKPTDAPAAKNLRVVDGRSA